MHQCTLTSVNNLKAEHYEHNTWQITFRWTKKLCKKNYTTGRFLPDKILYQEQQTP